MVSRIGGLVTNPALLEVRHATPNGVPVTQLKRQIEGVASDPLARIPMLIDDFMAGKIEVF
jgi:S-adenosylmethionine synthetase